MDGRPLFKQPWIYEYIYPETAADSADACERIVKRFAPGRRLSVLEIGFGVGRVLARMAEVGHRAVGIDSSQAMVDYASVLHPGLELAVADMRDFQLSEKFDIVLCIGSTFTFNLTNAEVDATLANFRHHCKDGGLLILGLLNASRFLGSETFNELVEIRVDEGEFHATAFSRHILDRRRQSFRRVRTWKIDGQDEPVVDDAEFRLFFPLELENYLSQHGFAVLGLWDNKELKETDLSDRRIYVAARAE